MCPQCNGELVMIGQLGTTIHYRCRCCGITCSYED